MSVGTADKQFDRFFLLVLVNVLVFVVGLMFVMWLFFHYLNITMPKQWLFVTVDSHIT